MKINNNYVRVPTSLLCTTQTAGIIEREVVGIPTHSPYYLFTKEEVNDLEEIV